MSIKAAKPKVWMALWAVAAIALIAAGAERLASFNRVRLENASKEDQLAAAAELAAKASLLEHEQSALQERVEFETRQLFAQDEMDAYRFGILINNLLESSGAEVTSTKMIESGGRTILEYIFQGPNPGIIQFLRKVALYEKRLDVPYLSLGTQSDGARMYAVMRISYARNS